MSTLKKVAGALSSFAHLNPLAKAKAEDDEDKDKKERDHEDGDAKKAEDKKEDEKAESNDEDMKASDEDEGEDDKKKNKKAKAADDDDDKDEEMRGNSPAASARRREQERCAAIFSSPMAAKNPVLAANLAFKTRMSRAEALAVLEGTPAPVAPTNASRASKNPNVGTGSSPVITSQQAIASSWDATFKKVRGGR